MNTDILQQHTPSEVTAFAKEIGISEELAQKIEQKREWYMLWEHDYIRKSKLEAVIK